MRWKIVNCIILSFNSRVWKSPVSLSVSCLYLFLCVYVCLPVCDCLCICFCLCLSVSVCLFLCFYLCLSVHASLPLCICLCLSLSVSVHLCFCVYLCLCLCLSVCVSDCVSISDYVSVSLCLYPRPSHFRRAIFLARFCTVHKTSATPRRKTARRRRPAEPLHYLNLLARGPSMARLLNAARAIFGTSGICK